MNDFRSGFWLGCLTSVLTLLMSAAMVIVLSQLMDHPFRIYIQWVQGE
jgi:hypothetical protein